jgi:hypothetical protein
MVIKGRRKRKKGKCNDNIKSMRKTPFMLLYYIIAYDIEQQI